jgi:hypothetical protein
MRQLQISYHVGIDWSGRPVAPADLNSIEYYVPGAVIVDSHETAANALNLIKQAHSYGANFEFKGSHLRKNEAALADVLEFVLDQCIVVCFVLNKQNLAHAFGPSFFNKPADIPVKTGLNLIKVISSRVRVTEILIDKDDIPRPLRLAFNTAARRIVGNDNGKVLRKGHPKHYASDKWPSIQFADIVCNVLARQARGRQNSARISKIAEAIRSKSGNVVVTEEDIELGGLNVDLQAYLQH